MYYFADGKVLFEERSYISYMWKNQWDSSYSLGYRFRFNSKS